MTTIGILGGSGEAGHVIAELLAVREDLDLVLMGRDEAKLASYCQSENPHLTTRTVDALDTENLREALADIDLLIVAAPLIDHVQQIAEVALETKTHWLDLLMDSPAKVEAFEELGPRFTEAGLKLISGTGIHPGLPAAMIRTLTKKIDSPIGTQVAMMMSVDWRKYSFTAETAAEASREISMMKAAGWVEGKYQNFSWTNPKAVRRVDFGSPFGVREAFMMELEEIKRIHDLFPDLKEAAMMMAGTHVFVDYVVLPLCLVLLKLGFARRAQKLFWWGWTSFAKAPYGTVLLADAWDDGEDMVRLSVAHKDGYWLTAAVAAATTRQLIDSMADITGYHQAALIVDPEKLLDDIQNMGARVKNFTGKQNYDPV
ncbi:MAG: saccharopine dehydrogenase NADP-binding domain-containing protein [Propionibacteriaceae bacterium]|nr:saccharopine dehydrogenase NADP-binding domain-containing protein [Propionibacteriaceae bacterium]